MVGPDTAKSRRPIVVLVRCKLAMHDVGTDADADSMQNVNASCTVHDAWSMQTSDADVNPMHVLSMRMTYDARRLSRPTHDVLDACCRCRPTMHDVDAVVDTDSRYYTTTFLHLGILLFLLVDECMNNTVRYKECMNTVNTDIRNERTLLFIDAIHIDDDKRLLISSHMFALCFTDSVSWLEF